MAARSRASSSGSRGSRGDMGLREAIDAVAAALPLGSLTRRLASVEKAASRLEREARRVLGGGRSGGAAKRSTAKRGTAKAAGTAKRSTAKRGTTAKAATGAKRSTAKRGTAKAATTAKRSTAKRGTAKAATTAKRSTAKRTTTRSTGATSRRGGAAPVSEVASPTRAGALASLPGGSEADDLAGRRDRLIAELSRPSEPQPQDDELASKELSFAAGVPEVPGPLP
jgi:hypothetical protein